jgi:predicted dehydrogenase
MRALLTAVTSLGVALAVAPLATARVASAAEGGEPVTEVRLMTLDPGHFHAALVQKEMVPGVSRKVDVYAPLGPDLLDHLARVARFNLRRESPTDWEVEVHTGPDFLERMCRERPGNVVVISGRNRGKIGRIQASLDAGLHALVDKPWILEPDDLPRLETALDAAERRGLVALDIMTERFEVTTELQRELVDDRETFGTVVPGTADEPAVSMESVHHLMKTVAGAALVRPSWFFDTAEQGEGLNDVGTHLVDLVQWTLFPDVALDYRKDVKVLRARRWPTMVPRAGFEKVTGGSFPRGLFPQVKDGALEYFCNTLVSYVLRDVNVSLRIIWDWEAPSGSGDTHFASYRGSRSRVEVRQGKAERYRTELYVVPSRPEDKAGVLAAVRRKLGGIQDRFLGTQAVDLGPEIRIEIPDRLRVGHEEHFAQVMRDFLRYVRDRRTLPAWERPNMLAKYYVTTEGTRLARLSPVAAAEGPAPR